MRNFKDSNLKNSIFLLELVTAIEPRAVDWEVVKRWVFLVLSRGTIVRHRLAVSNVVQSQQLSVVVVMTIPDVYLM